MIPVFLLIIDGQFQVLVKQLTTIQDDAKWKELTDMVKNIQANVAAQNDLIPFLGECGVSIGNNLSAGVLFIFLEHLLMG